MVEYLAVRDLAHQSNRVHAFVSSFHRVADEDQRKELKNHNMEVFSLRTKENASACTKWIAEKLKANKEVVVHIDECDFGSGEKQILAEVYKAVRNNNKITCILYSATPEEVLFSGEVEETSDEMIEDFAEGEWIDYEPPKSFCGPKTFLFENLVKEAKPFFYYKNSSITLSEQGKQIITDLKDSCADGKGRNILVLRLSYADLGKGRANRKENKAIYQFLKHFHKVPELDGCRVYVDKNEGDVDANENLRRQKIAWSDKGYWEDLTDKRPLIFVIDQTSSRSTEWACHDRVFAYHDFRNTISFSTISQAQERVNHYSTKYPGGFQQIEVYGHFKTFLLSAGKISYSEYIHHDWKAKKVDKRVAAREGYTEDMYTIQSTDDSHQLHPDYPYPLTQEEADMALQELGCFVDVKMSARVKGTIKTSAVVEAEFHPCDERTCETVLTKLRDRLKHPFRNPFINSSKIGKSEEGLWKGNYRLWKVFEYDDDLKDDKGGFSKGNLGPRLTICYNKGVLGLALRYHTGEFAEQNTLKSHNSMYKKE
jgi:hypothetical protein